MAASLPSGKPNVFDIQWVQSSLRKANAEGIGRTLFSVRLLDHEGYGTAEQRLSFLYGAFLAGEIESAEKYLGRCDRQVLVSGSSALAAVWCELLQEASISATPIEDSMRETAYLTGLGILAEKSGLLI